jgi:hypothetical protein
LAGSVRTHFQQIRTELLSILADEQARVNEVYAVKESAAESKAMLESFSGGGAKRDELEVN